MNNDINIDPTIDITNEISLDKQKIHIRIKQRNKKKSITTIEGLSNDLNICAIMQEMRKIFSCNGCVQKDKSIMLFGDQRSLAKKFLIDNSIAPESDIIIHGY